MNLQEYKKWKSPKSLKLPSGLEIKVRDLSPWDLLVAASKQKEYKPNDPQLIEHLMKRFIVWPEIGKDWEIDDIRPDDFVFLQTKLFESFSLERFDNAIKEVENIKERHKDFSE